jgi:hypothetical protein
LTFTLTACFSSDDDGEDEVVSETAYITLTASPESINADGASSSAVTAVLTDNTGQLGAKGTSVTFSTTLGAFSNGSATYQTTISNDSGSVTVSLISSTTAGIAKVTVTSNGVTQSTTVEFTATSVVSETAYITLTASPESINADGASSSAITATLTDNTGEPVAKGTSVTFSTTLGAFSNGSATYQTTTPDDSGTVTISLISSTTEGAAKITAVSNGITQRTTVVFTSTTSETAYIALAASPESINADGASSSAITATLTDNTGEPVAKGTSLTFSTTLGTFSNGSATYQTTTPDDSGIVTVSLISSTTAGTAEVTAASNGVTQTTSVVLTGIGVPASLSLGLSQITVKSDNSDSATITATVLDRNNAVVEGITVLFSATDGELSASSVFTDPNGDAVVTFSSGNADKSNRIATIAASVSGLDPKQIPVQITGTTVELSTATTNLEIGGTDTAILTVTVLDAYPTAIYDAPVTLSIDPASSGAVTLLPAAGNTDVTGNLEVSVTGAASGVVTVIAESLGATATQTYTVGNVGDVFIISSPTEDPYSLSTNTDLTITVNAPYQTQVQFSTTFGAWDGGTDMVVVKSVSGGVASATLRSAIAGVATVQVFDVGDVSTTDSVKIAISAPSGEASQLSLQASSMVVAPSTGEISNTVTLIATVKNANDQVVGGAPVAFSIENPTGGGERISPVIAYTDDYGTANSTFTSGSLSSGAEGITIRAQVVGMSAVTDDVSIVIGGNAGSVVIGRSTKIESIDEDTAYRLPMSVLVSDSNGNPVSGAVVSLSTWPTQYATGYWVDDEVSYAGFYPNEDENNRNLILDPGEDTGTNPGHGDGELTPPNSAAGSLPGTVTTDDNGIANFDLVYLKASAVWIEDEIAASTLVLGTETRSTINFWLPYLKGDEESLPPSPYNN